MNCEEVRNDLASRPEHSGDPVSHRDEHLQTCRECRVFEGELDAVLEALQDLGREELSQAALDALSARVQTRLSQERPAHGNRFLHWAAVLGSAAVLAGSMLLLYTPGPSVPAREAHEKSASNSSHETSSIPTDAISARIPAGPKGPAVRPVKRHRHRRSPLQNRVRHAVIHTPDPEDEARPIRLAAMVTVDQIEGRGMIYQLVDR